MKQLKDFKTVLKKNCFDTMHIGRLNLVICRDTGLYYETKKMLLKAPALLNKALISIITVFKVLACLLSY